MQNLESTIPLPYPEMPAEVAIRLGFHSGRHCTQCGAELWVHIGEPIKQWDSEDFKFIEMQDSQVYDCDRCRARLRWIFLEVEKMRFMRNRADREPPKDKRGKDTKPTLDFLRWKERAKRIFDQQEKHVHGLAAGWGFAMQSVYDRMRDIEVRRLRHLGIA